MTLAECTWFFLKIKSNQFGPWEQDHLSTGLSTCLLQLHTLALSTWCLIALTFNRWLTTPEGSWKATTGFALSHCYRGSAAAFLYSRWTSEPNLAHSLSRNTGGEGWVAPCPFPIPRIFTRGVHRSTYWEQHLSGEAFTVEDTEGAPCRLLWLLICDAASCRLLPLSRGRAPGAREPCCFSKAAVLLMSPQTERTTPICSKYISLSS